MITNALLRSERLHASIASETGWDDQVQGDFLLGAIGYGEATSAYPTEWCAAPVHARMLLGGTPCVDTWSGGSDQVQSGRCGAVFWRHDATWLFGIVEFDETGLSGDLATLAEAAYDDVFATLRTCGFDHLVRLWNYLPNINADEGGMERYRQFNVGRQQAFLKAQRGVHEGAPAACALGTRGGRFSIRFLAGKVAPEPIENPRQVSAYHYPADYGPRSPTFSRASLVPAGNANTLLLISGTASIVGHASLHIGDVIAQTRETLRNLQAVVDAANSRSSGRFALAELTCTVYVRNPGDAETINAELTKALGTSSATVRNAVYLEADICRSDLLVEIEAHAFAPCDA